MQEQSNPETAYVQAEKLCRLLAFLHDIGKMTPAFQSKISSSIEEHNENMLRDGLDITQIYDAAKSPHQIAGQAILEYCKFPNEIAVLVGSHHGKGDLGQSCRQMRNYPYNCFGKGCCQETIWRSIWNEWILYALDSTGFTLETLPKPNVKSQMLLTGLL